MPGGKFCDAGDDNDDDGDQGHLYFLAQKTLPGCCVMDGADVASLSNGSVPRGRVDRQLTVHFILHF